MVLFVANIITFSDTANLFYRFFAYLAGVPRRGETVRRGIKKKKTLTSPLPYNKTLCTKVIFSK